MLMLQRRTDMAPCCPSPIPGTNAGSEQIADHDEVHRKAGLQLSHGYQPSSIKFPDDSIPPPIVHSKLPGTIGDDAHDGQHIKDGNLDGGKAAEDDSGYQSGSARDPWDERGIYDDDVRGQASRQYPPLHSDNAFDVPPRDPDLPSRYRYNEDEFDILSMDEGATQVSAHRYDT